jgi:glycine/D-amino acid oxidase-like deaminating enzyme
MAGISTAYELAKEGQTVTAARLPAASRPGHQPIPHRIATIRLRYDRPSRGRHLLRSLRNYTLVTLKDAANYIQKLPKVEQDLEDWQAAVEPCSWWSNSTGQP